MELHGVSGSPYKHPRVNRTIPAPFQRPSINAGGGQVKRKWQPVRVSDLHEGDTVADFGTIAAQCTIKVRDPLEYFVEFTNVHGDVRRYKIHDEVFAFSTE